MAKHGEQEGQRINVRFSRWRNCCEAGSRDDYCGVVETTSRGEMRALLVQPPVYDTQYYAEWSMPSGLLKVATWLRMLKYELRLIDCLYPNADGQVKHEIRKIVQVCSTTEWSLSDYRQLVKERTGKTTIELPA